MPSRSYKAGYERGRRSETAFIAKTINRELLASGNVKNINFTYTYGFFQLDIFCSQSVTQEEGGIVLDVDENAKPLIKVHKKLTDNLKPHQCEGIKFMWSMCYESVKHTQENPGAGCILAHCMGLGKTRQIVVLCHTLLSHRILNVKNILVVCPLSTVANWLNEFRKTLIGVNDAVVRVFDIRSNFNTQKKVDTVKMWRDIGGVLIMGYDTFQALVSARKNKNEMLLTILREALLDPGPQLIVCDEGHLLKNGQTRRFKALSKVETKRRIILTGTPLQNNLKEYYHMVNFVRPNLLGTESEYNNRFVNPILNGQYEDSSPDDIRLMRGRAHVLHKKLETTVQRYESSELEKYMPMKDDYVLFVAMTNLQIELYKRFLAEKVDHSIGGNKHKKLFENYHELQNVWTHPAMLKMRLEKRGEKKQKTRTYEENVLDALDPDREVAVSNDAWFMDLCPDDIKNNVMYGPKIMILLSIIDECVLLNEKLLVFASSLIELDLIEHFLNMKNWRKNYDYYRMDGTVEPEQRSRFCDLFNNELNTKGRLFLISHKVGGLGLNLFAASRVVLMDVNWNPTYDDQSVYRSYRFGQKKNCIIYRLVSMGTMEEVVHSRAITKLAIAARVVDEHQISRHFKSDDLQKMYRLDCDYPPRKHDIPQDKLLTKLLFTQPMIMKYCKHKSLFQKLPHEELNEAEREKAWKEYEDMENMKTKTNSSLSRPTTSYDNQIPTTSGIVPYYNSSCYPYPTYSQPQYDEQYYGTNNTNYAFTSANSYVNNSMQQNIAQIPNYTYHQNNNQGIYMGNSFRQCPSNFTTTEQNIYQPNNIMYQQNMYNQHHSYAGTTTTVTPSTKTPVVSNPLINNCIYKPQSIPTGPIIPTVNHTNYHCRPINQQSTIDTVTSNMMRQHRPSLRNVDRHNIIRINTALSYLPGMEIESNSTNNIIPISLSSNSFQPNIMIDETELAKEKVSVDVVKTPTETLVSSSETQPQNSKETTDADTLSQPIADPNTDHKDALIVHAQKIQSLQTSIIPSQKDNVNLNSRELGSTDCKKNDTETTNTTPDINITIERVTENIPEHTKEDPKTSPNNFSLKKSKHPKRFSRKFTPYRAHPYGERTFGRPTPSYDLNPNYNYYRPAAPHPRSRHVDPYPMFNNPRFRRTFRYE